MFSGTAMAAISNDSHSALIAAGVVIHAHATPKPCSNVLTNTTRDGQQQQQQQVHQRDGRSDSARGG